MSTLKVGASNLVAFKKQSWIACDCTSKCNNSRHGAQIPNEVEYKLFAKRCKIPSPNFNESGTFIQGSRRMEAAYIIRCNIELVNSTAALTRLQ